MHSYRSHAGKWQVVFVHVTGPATVIRTYDTEAQAASWASYLNGGHLPDNAVYGSV